MITRYTMLVKWLLNVDEIMKMQVSLTNRGSVDFSLVLVSQILNTSKAKVVTTNSDTPQANSGEQMFIKQKF